ncbi:MAG TPA: hypothetical protein VJK03_02415 [Candidatus Nanoarchaeia archaeon]|nr:hypothetical protein [Candidatus Nanoarchaeia archaeon]
MNKRGVGHIEMILAFLLFVSATITIFSIFNVQQQTTTHESSISYVSYEIAKRASITVVAYSVALNNTAISQQEIIAIELPQEIPLEWGVRAENYSGALLPSRISEQRNTVFVKRGGSSFFYLTTSEDIPPSGEQFLTLPNVNASYYRIASMDEKTFLSEKRVRALNASYYADYTDFKRQLKVSNRLDFTFSLTFDTRDFINAARDIPSRTEVLVKTQRQEVLRETGGKAFADFSVKLW